MVEASIAYHKYAIILVLLVLVIPVKSQNSTSSTLTTGSSTTGGLPFSYIPINSLPINISGDTTTAPSVPFSGCSVTKPGIVYEIIGDGTVMQATTCPSHGGSYSFDTFLYVSDLSRCIAQNDEFCLAGSFITWSSKLSTKYYVFIAGFQLLTGRYTIAFRSVVPSFSYIPVPYLPYTDSNDTSVAPVVTAVPCNYDNNNAYVYSIVGAGEYIVASLCEADGGSELFQAFVYATDLMTCFAQNNECETGPRVSFFTSPGVTYYIVVTGMSTNVGNYTVAITGYAVHHILKIPYYVSNDTSNAPLINFISCINSKQQGYIYSVTGDGGTMQASLCSRDGGYANYSSLIYEYDSLTCKRQEDYSCSRVSWQSIYGTIYYVFVTGIRSSTGPFTLALSSSGLLGTVTLGTTGTTGTMGTTGTGADYGTGMFFVFIGVPVAVVIVVVIIIYSSWRWRKARRQYISPVPLTEHTPLVGNSDMPTAKSEILDDSALFLFRSMQSNPDMKASFVRIGENVYYIQNMQSNTKFIQDMSFSASGINPTTPMIIEDENEVNAQIEKEKEEGELPKEINMETLINNTTEIQNINNDEKDLNFSANLSINNFLHVKTE